MTIKCFCQICTCGRHQCPHSPPPAVIPTSRSDTECVLSEYRDRFRHHGATATRRSKKVKHEYTPPEGDMANTTTFRADYVPHEVTMRLPKATMTYMEPIGTMLLKSTYMQDFVSHPVHKNIVSKTVTYNAPTAKMDGQSVYQEVYQCWNVVRPEPFRASNNLTVSQDKFDATTTCQDDFCPKNGTAVRKSFKPTQQIQEPQPFEGTTNYRLAYVSHPAQKRPPKEKVPYKPNSAPFNGVSTHQQDFRGVRGEVARSAKTKSTWEASTAPFEGSTEYQERYQAWPMPPRVQRKSDGHSLPGGAMELISTAHGDFAGQQGQKAVSARPPIQAWCKGKPFDACSTRSAVLRRDKRTH